MEYEIIGLRYFIWLYLTSFDLASKYKYERLHFGTSKKRKRSNMQLSSKWWICIFQYGFNFKVGCNDLGRFDMLHVGTILKDSFCFPWGNQRCLVSSDTGSHEQRNVHRCKRAFQYSTDVRNLRSSNTQPGLRDTPIVKILRCQNGNFCILSHLCRIDWLSDRVIKIRSGFLT